MEEGGDDVTPSHTETKEATLVSFDDIPNATATPVIEISTNNQDDSKQEKVEEDAKTKPEITEQKVEKNPEEKLCGWLQLRSRGIGNFKVNRSRWFLFGDDNCRLYIYRDPNDLVPLGEICIATASFYFDAGNVEKPGLFQIKSESKEFHLDAGNRHNMIFWLQSLQDKRREYSIARLSAVTENKLNWSNKRTTQVSGLISKELSDSPQVSRRELDPGQGILDLQELHITVPESSGNNNNTLSASSKTTSVRAFNNLKSEIQQKISNFTKPGKAQKGDNQSDPSLFYYEHSGDQDQMSTSTASISSETSQENQSESTSQTELSAKTYKYRASSFEPSSGRINPFDKEFMRNRAYTTESNNSSQLNPNQTGGREAGSWTLISQTDVPPAEAKEILDQKGLKSSESNSQFYTDIDNSETEKTVERTAPVEDGKAKNLMNTLKRIRIGKRQMSEPGSTGKSVLKVTGTCPKCKAPVPAGKSEPNSTVSKGDNGASQDNKALDLEEELKAHKEIVMLLQNKLADLVKEENTRQELGKLEEKDKECIIVEKTRLVEDLQLQLADIKNENKTFTDKMRMLETELAESQDQVGMYTDMLKTKDDIIMDLTNQIFAHDNPGQVPDNFNEPRIMPNLVIRDSAGSLRSEKSFDEKEFEKLKDMCQGYELQHKFLTKEILEMNELRKMDLAKEKELMMKLETTKARYCQVKSKYFVLLKQQKEQAPVREGADEQDVVNQLLQDALEADTDDVDLQLTGSGQHYDKYGFSKKHYMDEFEDQDDEDPLSSKAVELERQSTEISTKVREADQEASLRVKWENYMVGRQNKLNRSSELKALIRQGVLHEYREQVWKGCINLYIMQLREAKGPGFYQSLLQAKAKATGSDPAIKQIELDLLRTLPNNKHYESIESDGIIRLRKVLLAFSEYNRVIGYCQGLNRLAAIALLFLEEEEAFWCLVAIVDHLLPPEYFSSTLMAAQADQRVLKDLVADKLPKIHQALEGHGVDLSLFTFNWFLTVFVDGVPTETFLRIWDTFLYEGSKVLFRFAIAFLKMVEDDIIKQKDSLQLNRYLRRIGDKMTNLKQISFYAFSWINPFPMTKVASRRQQHMADIKVELKELDKLRHGLKVSREQSQHHDYMSDDDLDS